MSNENPTLKVDNYSIEQTAGGFGIFKVSKADAKEWLATASDPEVAMTIVEGLILVEMKRFYHPDSKPTFKSTAGETLPPFLRKGSEGS